MCSMLSFQNLNDDMVRCSLGPELGSLPSASDGGGTCLSGSFLRLPHRSGSHQLISLVGLRGFADQA